MPFFLTALTAPSTAPWRAMLPALRPRAAAWLLLVLLAGCDIPGLDDDSKKAAEVEADGRAIGGACRHALRGVEDCYQQNPKAQRAAVFNGWKDMDLYMRENKIEGTPPPPPKPVAAEPAEEIVEKAEPKKGKAKAAAAH